MKPLVLIFSVMVMLVSCTGIYYPPIDNTPPEIVSVYTSPSTVVPGHEFTVIVQVYDAESFVTVSYDLDNDGLFNDDDWGVFPSFGSKTIAVRAESPGGVTVGIYYLSEESLSLDFLLTFSAESNGGTGDFLINYTIKNHRNVPIYLMGNSYKIYDSNYIPIAVNNIGIDQNSLAYNTYLAVNASTNAILEGYSMYLMPSYYDMTIYYNYGNGSSISEMYLGGIFYQ